MLKPKFSLSLLIVLFFSSLIFARDWQLVWSDEFEGDQLDESKWSYQIGTGFQGWGNNELQYYREQNATVENGVLTITAKKENCGGKKYTSARIRTKNKGDWLYGRFEIRAKMPIGQGLWPAIWMMPTDEVYGGWAASGEIDIMEYLGQEPGCVHGTLHFGGKWPNNKQKGKSISLQEGSFHDNFHVFALEWEEGNFRWYLDDTLYQTQGRGDWYTTGQEFPAPFDQRFYLLLNLAVGGNWPGSPNDETRFPQHLVVDYVRVYQKKNTGVGESNNKPGAYSLGQNVPNPFNSRTTISYFLPQADSVTLKLFDVNGRSLRTWTKSAMPGHHIMALEANDMPSGVVFYQLRTSTFSSIRRMLCLK